MNVAWKKFVHTRFYLPIKHSPDFDPKKITLVMTPGSAAGDNTVQISEVRERITQGDAVLWLNGAEVIAMLPPDGAIQVALATHAYPIPSDRIAWLREGLRVAQARAAAKVPGAAATPPSSGAPGIATVFASAAPDAAKPSAQRGSLPANEIAALRPRKLGLADLGLEFSVPGAWREERIAKVLHLHDRDSGMRVEVRGMQQPDLSLDQWVSMRVEQLGQEMRFLKQSGPVQPIEGVQWQPGLSGKMVEFAGTFPGETVPGRYLLACIHREGTVVSLAVRATAEVFAQQRSLVQWLIGSVSVLSKEDLAARRAAAAAAASERDMDDGVTDTPALFGFNLHGRIGRLRALAYSVPTVIPSAALAIGAAVVMPKAMVLGAIMAITGVILLLWFSLRLMILRLHDVNRSGKWVLLFLALSGLAGALHSPVLLGIASLAFWLFVFVIYYFVPGTRGQNDYGPPPGPNTQLVQIGAAVFVLFQLFGIYANVKMASMLKSRTDTAAAQGSKLTPFAGPGQKFVVDLPGVPTPVPSSPWMNQQNGGVQVQQFYLEQAGRQYLIQSLDFGPAPRDSYALMNRAEQSVMGGDGKVEGTKAFLFNNGVNGREVRVKRADGSIRLARLVYHSGMLVVLMIAGPDDAATGAHADQVFQSFQLK